MAWKEPVFVATVESMKQTCSAGHKVGDTFQINKRKTGGICGWCYHDLFPTLMTLSMDGRIPWNPNPNEFKYICPDRSVEVAFKITKNK
jgi:uncharacterized repeat protein (TIGR04076 family)